MKYSKLIILIFAVLFSFSLTDNINEKYIIDSDFSLTIKGTSNVHDWQSNARVLNGTSELSISDDGYLTIQSCEVTVPVKSIKSKKGSIMDKKTRKALSEKEYPNITYSLKRFTPILLSENDFRSNTTGDLTVSGVTKSVDIEVIGKSIDDQTIELSSTVNLKMTDFGISPPTALMGTMKTGDDITIEFQIKLNRS